jgi:hypothetical protein
MVNQATVISASTAACPSASQKCDLPVPDGPQMQRFSLRCTHSSVFSASWVGRGMVDACSSQSPKVLPAGNVARFAAGAQVGRVPAGGLLGQQDPHDLGRVPALGFGGRDQIGQRLADVGQFQAFGMCLTRRIVPGSSPIRRSVSGIPGSV